MQSSVQSSTMSNFCLHTNRRQVTVFQSNRTASYYCRKVWINHSAPYSYLKKAGRGLVALHHGHVGRVRVVRPAPHQLLLVDLQRLCNQVRRAPSPLRSEPGEVREGPMESAEPMAGHLRDPARSRAENPAGRPGRGTRRG